MKTDINPGDRHHDETRPPLLPLQNGSLGIHGVFFFFFFSFFGAGWRKDGKEVRGKGGERERERGPLGYYSRKQLISNVLCHFLYKDRDPDSCFVVVVVVVFWGCTSLHRTVALRLAALWVSLNVFIHYFLLLMKGGRGSGRFTREYPSV